MKNFCIQWLQVSLSLFDSLSLSFSLTLQLSHSFSLPKIGMKNVCIQWLQFSLFLSSTLSLSFFLFFLQAFSPYLSLSLYLYYKYISVRFMYTNFPNGYCAVEKQVLDVRIKHFWCTDIILNRFLFPITTRGITQKKKI